MSKARIAQLENGFEVDGAYRIEGRIGAGGMATVYRARLEDTGQAVAIKLIDLGQGDVAATRKRFFNELLLATRVRHSNIVSVYDFGLLTSLGTPYIVMELLEGVNLRQHIRRFGPLPLDEALPLFLGALGALQEAHDHAVVHKDLKPSNLFMCQQPNDEGTSLVIVDFGIAMRVSGSGDDSNEYHGTPRYSPPEYIVERVVRPGLDVYQMGLVFCEAVSGRPVVTASNARDCFRAHVKGKLDIPEDALGPKLTHVIRRALAADPEERFQDAGELLAAMRGAAGNIGDPTLRKQEMDTDELTRLRDEFLRKGSVVTGDELDSVPSEGGDLPTGILDWEDSDFQRVRESEPETTRPQGSASGDPTKPTAASGKQTLKNVKPKVRPVQPSVSENPSGQRSGVLRVSAVITLFVVAAVCCASGALFSWAMLG